MRVMRFSNINHIVPPALRTTSLALHQFSIPLGLLLASRLWFLVKSSRGRMNILGLTVDRFSVLYSLNAVFTAALALLVNFALPSGTTPAPPHH